MTARILHIIETEGPGGAETVLVDLVHGLRDAQTETRAVIPVAQSWLGRALPAEARAVIPPSTVAFSAPIDLAYVRALRAEIVRYRPTVVHAHNFDAALYAALALRGSALPLAVTFHGASDVERRGVNNRIKWWMLRRANAIVCVSHRLQALAQQVPGVPRGRLRAIHNGSDLARIPTVRSTALRERLGLAPTATLIGALGNVRGPKGYNFLLDAVANLRSRGHDVHIAIAGDDAGALGDALKAQRSALALDSHVTFLGFQDDPGDFLAGLDLFVLPSTSEGFSISTVQALAAGLPVVATRSGGPEEIVVNDVSGLLVPAGSADALVAGLTRVIEDPALAQRLASQGRERAASHFSLQTMLRAYRALYAELSREPTA